MKKEQIVVISDHTVDPADRMISENTLPGLSKLFSDLAKLKVEDTKASIIEGYDFNEKMAKEVVKTTLIYLDEHVKHNIKGRKRGLSRSEKSELEGQVLGFINDFYDNPKLDGGLIRSNQKNSGLILSQVGSTYYSVENGIPILLASKTTGDGIKAAFSVDVLIEFISLFTSLAGFSIKLPKGARKAIAKVIAKFARNKRHRELLKQLYKALYKKDWKKVLEILDKAELRGLIGEILHHWYSEMGWGDYVITIAKFLAFLALLIASGGWALGIRLVAVGLDVLGLGVKINHGVERGWM